MSYTPNEERALADYQADLDMALSENDWKAAAHIIFTVKEEGYEHEAEIMNQTLQRAYTEQESDADKKLHKEEIDAEINGTEDRLRDDSF